jgi:excisionase family DNA binding protein
MAQAAEAPERALLLNRKEAAALLGITPQTLRLLVKAGAIEAVRVDGLESPRYAGATWRAWPATAG